MKQSMKQLIIRHSAKTFGERQFLGTRAFLSDGKRGTYEWISYKQAHERWVNIASGLRGLGLKKVTFKLIINIIIVIIIIMCYSNY